MAEETKEERLNNEEFRALLPHLELKDLFLTEIKIDTEWVKIFTGFNEKKFTIYCSACKKTVGLSSFTSHIKGQEHKNAFALKDVKQFYHPVYTYDKSSQKLALRKSVSEYEIIEGIKLAKAAMDCQPSSSIAEAKRLSKMVEDFAGKKIIILQIDDITDITCTNTDTFNLVTETKNDFVRCNLCEMPKRGIKAFRSLEILNSHLRTPGHIEKTRKLKTLSLKGHPELSINSIIQIDLDSKFAIEYNKAVISIFEKDDIQKSHQMRIICGLQLNDMLALEQKSSGVWKPIFLPIDNTEKKVECTLCHNTFKISSLNGHCAGNTHKTKQLAAEKLRHPLYENISKIYVFYISSKYVVKTSIAARKPYHDQVIKILKDKKVIDQSASKKDEQSKNNNIMEYKLENETENVAGEEIEDAPDTILENELEHENQSEFETIQIQNDPEFEQDGEVNDVEEKDDNENAEIIEIESDDECEKQSTEAENFNKQGDGPEQQETNALNLNEKEVKEQEDEPEKQRAEAAISKGNDEVEHKNDKTYKKELPSKIAAKVKDLRDAEAARIARKELISNTTSKNGEIVTPDNALIGVEYVVKILKHPQDGNAKYECCLCKIVRNQRRMEIHLTGYLHRLKYCELHYRNAFRKFTSYLKGLVGFDRVRVLAPMLDKLACEIEKANGRGIPYAVSAEEFDADRKKIVDKLNGEKHACQLIGPSLTNILSEEDIKKNLANKDSVKAPRLDRNITYRYKQLVPGQRYCNVKLKSERVPSFNIRKSDSGEKKYSSLSKVGDETSRRIGGNLSPRRDSSTSNIWEKYRQEILLSASEIEREYKNYRKCPDSHPLYDQEWNKFWKKRRDDLVSRRVDPRNHNFHSEWVPYFKKRMEELFGEELEQAKLDVRIRLNIPLDAVEDSKFSPSIRCFEKVSTNIRREPPIKRARIDTDNLVMQWNSQDKYAQNGQNSNVSHERFIDRNRFDGKPDLIHVLRLMAAFEDYLGSLGPKITDLLFSALALEKQIPNNLNLLERTILTFNNCSLLETAMEKLKGTLLAGFLDSSKEPGMNRLIDCTTNLLTYADNMGYLKQFPPTENHNFAQINTNSQFSSNIRPNTNNVMDKFSGSNPYVSANIGNQFSDFQSQQFGTNKSCSSGVPTHMNMNMKSNEVLTAAMRTRFEGGRNIDQSKSFVQMTQRNMNVPGLRGNASANMNMANIGINNYNNSILNNQIANNNDRNFPNKGNIQNTGLPAGYWKPFSGENVTGSLQQNSGGRMWQRNMPGQQQQNFMQQRNQ